MFHFALHWTEALSYVLALATLSLYAVIWSTAIKMVQVHRHMEWAIRRALILRVPVVPLTVLVILRMPSITSLTLVNLWWAFCLMDGQEILQKVTSMHMDSRLISTRSEMSSSA